MSRCSRRAYEQCKPPIGYVALSLLLKLLVVTTVVVDPIA
jgi:hypothetical protein